MPPRYTDEFKIDAIKQVLKNGYGVTEKMDIFLCLHFLWEKRPQRTFQTTQIKVHIYKRVSNTVHNQNSTQGVNWIKKCLLTWDHSTLVLFGNKAQKIIKFLTFKEIVIKSKYLYISTCWNRKRYSQKWTKNKSWRKN